MGDTWTINYLPEEGGRLTGKLTVGDADVRFSALYDSSNKEVIKGVFGSIGAFVGTGGHAVYIHDTDTDFEVVLPRSDIVSAAQAKKGMMKRAVVTMKDGSEFVFDYGMLSTKKLVAAING
ncbi:MAG: hypothetical protein ABFS21_10155 [Actinomycetota bacterium]